MRALNVRAVPYNAIANSDGAGGGTDAAPAIQAAILALDPLRGGRVFVPYGRYRLASTVNIDRPVTFVGDGHNSIDPATQFVVDAGVTGFIVWSGGNTAPDPNSQDGAQQAVLENFSVIAAGQLTTSQTGTYSLSDPTHVTLSAAGDFKTGQLIRIAGAGQSGFTFQRMTAATTSGSQQVTLTTADGTPSGIRVGDFLIIGTAYPSPTRVTAISGNVLTMASNAATPLASSMVNYVDDFWARITAGGGTTTLTIDNRISGALPVSAGTVTGYHADSAIYVRNSCVIRDVDVGSGLLSPDFPGAAVFIYGDHGAPLYSNCNDWRVTNLFGNGRGSAPSMRHVLRIHGTDTNAGMSDGVYGAGCSSWTLLDGSFLGNTHVGPGMQGGNGILTVDNPPCRCTIIGAYNEGGTYSHFGGGTNVIGGTLSLDAGGWSWVGETINQAVVGGRDGTQFTNETQFSPSAFARVPSFASYVGAGPTISVTDATDTIQITTSSPHGYSTGSIITIVGVAGNTNANGTFPITVVDATTFELNNIRGNGTYAGGGTAQRGAGPMISITDATDAIQITTSRTHGYITGSRITIAGLAGATPEGETNNANGISLPITVVDATSFALDSRTGNGAYITDASNTSPIKITTSSPHRFSTGSRITIAGLAGATVDPATYHANGTFPITRLDDMNFTLDGTTGNGAYITDASYTSPIKITTSSSPHGFISGSRIKIAGVHGNWTANGTFPITVDLDPRSFTLDDTNGSGAFSGGGTAQRVTPGGFVYRMSDAAGDETVDGYFAWVHYGGNRKHPIMVSDTDGGLSGTPGDLWFPQGFWIGQFTALSLSVPGLARQVTLDDNPPVAADRRIGDIVLNRTAVPGGFVGQQAVEAGNPGTLLPFGVVEAQDLKSISLAGGASTLTLAEVGAASARIRFTGALTANIKVTAKTPFVQSGSGPNSRTWIFQNHTTGAFSVTIHTAADAGIVLAQNKSQIMWSDGTTMFAAAPAV